MGEVRADTVGVPAPDVELKIDDNGEIHYRSPGVFVEYYNNPDSTASTKDAEGWVATGDAGFIEEKARAICGSSTAPRMWARWPMGRCLRRNMSKTN